MNTDPFSDTFPLQSCEGWEPFDFLKGLDPDVVHVANSTPIPASAEPHHNTLRTVDEDTPSEQPPRGQQPPRPDKLSLVQLNNWDQEKTYDENPPSCIHYSIEC
jgi:hypothetical protein